MGKESKRYGVVTGGNKGVGYEVCKQLASKGIMVILTAKDKRSGLEAVDKLRECGFSDFVVFHQLDVADSESIDTLASFIKTQFGKLDILVNNEGVSGVEVDGGCLRAHNPQEGGEVKWSEIKWSEVMKQTYELAEECLKINYYGAKKMSETLMPLIKLSDSPRIINVTSSMAKLEKISNSWGKEMLSDIDKLSEERIDEVLKQFMEDFKEENKGWPVFMSAYVLSKVALNAYTRIQAMKFPSLRINGVCTGFVKTDITFNMGRLCFEEGAETPLNLLLH
ncbi:(+)-neomenthol dehydrogenase-like [Euphorbia lathyris]|uniref:(+)-neomenthol dehydrogenase-like n=1 Tax=Euphorbia lathyris TaxID=212925 RepID=UPI0033140E9E